MGAPDPRRVFAALGAALVLLALLGSRMAAAGGGYALPGWAGPAQASWQVAPLEPPPGAGTLPERWAVVTVTKPPSPAMQQLVGHAVAAGWHVLAVGLSTAPDGWAVDGAQFLSAGVQAGLPYRIASTVTPNHHARRNIGHLYAVHMGARSILDLDEDATFVAADALQSRFGPPRAPQGTAALTGRVNPYAFFGRPEMRPLGWQPHAEPEPLRLASALVGAPLVQHALGHGVLLQALPGGGGGNADASFVDRGPLHLPPHSRVPFASSDTLFHRDAFWALALPVTLPPEQALVWRSVVAQRHLGDVGGTVRFEAPLTDRLFAAAPLAPPAQALTDQLLAWVGQWNAPSPLLFDRLLAMANDAAVARLWGAADAQYVAAFLMDLLSVGYRPPALVQEGAPSVGQLAAPPAARAAPAPVSTPVAPAPAPVAAAPVAPAPVAPPPAPETGPTNRCERPDYWTSKSYSNDRAWAREQQPGFKPFNAGKAKELGKTSCKFWSYIGKWIKDFKPKTDPAGVSAADLERRGPPGCFAFSSDPPTTTTDLRAALQDPAFRAEVQRLERSDQAGLAEFVNSRGLTLNAHLEPGAGTPGRRHLPLLYTGVGYPDKPDFVRKMVAQLTKLPTTVERIEDAHVFVTLEGGSLDMMDKLAAAATWARTRLYLFPAQKCSRNVPRDNAQKKNYLVNYHFMWGVNLVTNRFGYDFVPVYEDDMEYLPDYYLHHLHLAPVAVARPEIVAVMASNAGRHFDCGVLEQQMQGDFSAYAPSDMGALTLERFIMPWGAGYTKRIALEMVNGFLDNPGWLKTRYDHSINEFILGAGRYSLFPIVPRVHGDPKFYKPEERRKLPKLAMCSHMDYRVVYPPELAQEAGTLGVESLGYD